MFIYNEKKKEEKITLIFEPHPDDVAFNIAGSISKWISEGQKIYICTVTTGNNSTFDPKVSSEEIEEIMMSEHSNAMSLLKIPRNHLIQWKYNDLGLDPYQDRKELLEKMVNLIRIIKPTTVITMDPRNNLNEENPDHRIVAMTGFEAAALAAYPNMQKEKGIKNHFVSRILFYTTPEPNLFIDIKGNPIKIKKKIGSIYKSQLELMFTELKNRILNLGYIPDLDKIDIEDLWGMICESNAKDTAMIANKYYNNHPEISPNIKFRKAEAFRIYFPGVVEKIKDILPKEINFI